MNVLRLPPITSSRQQKRFARRFDYSVGNSSVSIISCFKFGFNHYKMLIHTLREI